ncbi:hypothetical protein DLAC_09446 [Tieghemostelium lacteum]|uniref:ER membrane protein complex subunit 2 n=1 Tax=Tieghemostelium lacteum TaxID=361077 RepID=A0A151ZA37_TIELA|nr:hypothetical protein DLAC_09446 [Tieghemostelium lacteum]|eukprot:KYQ90805.1 hypothetical protein DLAC_09446 [Tieghemostelium lacteum]
MTSEIEEFENFEKKINGSRSFNWTTVRDTLRFLRKSKFRKSHLVSNYGYTLVVEYANKLDSNEKWDTIEQVLVASLDSDEIDKAQTLLDILIKQFGQSSIRASRLKGMILESKGEIQSAIEIYTNILEKYPADSMSMKRQITIFTSQGNYTKAIQLLNQYLQIFMVDFEAWLELSSLHLRLLAYKNAQFCYEEIILNAPINYIFYVKYAEITYSLGGSDNYILALKYFTHSLELNPPVIQNQDDNSIQIPTNLTSIYGIIMSIFSYCQQNAGNINKLKDSQLKLMEWSQNQLTSITERYNPTYLPIVNSFIKTTKINN